MNNPPAFQFYADDFISGVSDMTQSEVGAYIMLLAHSWNTVGLNAANPERLEILAKGKISEHVLGKFKLKNGRLFNKRQEIERLKQAKFRIKQSKNGAKGGRPNIKPKINPSLSSGVTLDETKKSSPISVSDLRSPNKELPAFAGEHKAFIDGWASNFKEHFRFDYAFSGGKDGKAVKDILKMGVLRIDLLEIAKKAWRLQKNFACKQASTIHGFYHNFNQIRTELNGAIIPNHSTITGTIKEHDGKNY